jgi:hypothetical protein
MECVLSMFVFRKKSHRFSRHFSNREVDHDLFVAVRMLFAPKLLQKGRRLLDLLDFLYNVERHSQCSEVLVSAPCFVRL